MRNRTGIELPLVGFPLLDFSQLVVLKFTKEKSIKFFLLSRGGGGWGWFGKW